MSQPPRSAAKAPPQSAGAPLPGLERSDTAERAAIAPAPGAVILGIGTDLANIERIGAVLERFGDRFRNRVFTEKEQRRAEARRETVATYAKRWAAKEACSKALGTGLRMGIAWRDMAVSNLRTGQPVMEVSGWAAERLAAMTPPGHQAVIHVSLTDDHPWAQAFVVIEARPLAASPAQDATPDGPRADAARPDVPLP